MQPVLEVISDTADESLKTMRVSLDGKRPNWHYHPEIELTFMAAGQGRMQVGNRVASCNAGNLIVLGPNLPHDFNPVDSTIGCDFFVVQFRRSALDTFQEMAAVNTFLSSATGGLLLEHTPGDLSAQFWAIVVADPDSRLALLFDILVRLRKLHGWKQLSLPADADQVAAGRNHQRLQKVIEAILDHSHRTISLDEIASLVHMAPPSFSRWFRHTMQMTFTDYLNRVRIEECCRQLRATEKSITTIAKDCGYESFSSFNRQFRRVKACTPRDWRKGCV